MTPSRMERITIRLPADLAGALGREARRRNESVSAVARAAIRAHLRRTGRRLSFVAPDTADTDIRRATPSPSSRGGALGIAVTE